MGDVVQQYLDTVQAILSKIATTQADAIDAAAQTCAESIAADRVVHLFGTGHSRILVEEMWPRYGSFPGFHPIVELSLTAYHSVTGANGLRQAMFLEKVPGLAAQILANFALDRADTLIAISSGGTNTVTIEVAEQMRALGITVIAITSVEHSKLATSSAPSGKRLFEVADIVIDTCTPVGDAAVTLPGMDAPVGPTTTVAGAAVIDAMKVRIAELLLERGITPLALPSALLVGSERSTQVFDDACDEHARRISKLYER